MNLPGTRQHRHAPLMRAMATAWLLLISAAAVINHIALSRLAEQVESVVTDARVDALEQRLEEFAERFLLVESTREDALPQTSYETERAALEQRLSDLEHALSNLPTDAPLQQLQLRLEQLEARLSAPRQTPTSTPRPRPSPPAVTSAPPAIEPPFQVIGSELRAGEPFLSILPRMASALAQVRLLRPGEADSGWRLERIEDNTAVFREGEHTHHLPVPGGRSIR
ncbi:TPA: hypothetical protein NIG70_000121 [Pseudomonas aeruginosa]|nr:hypothetical protein [Pseudomonas aeruginosa]